MIVLYYTMKMMKKFYLVFLVLGVFVGFLSSCDDDDKYIPELPVVTIESENGGFSMLPTESIVLKAKVGNTRDVDLAWFVNGEKVGTDSVYIFKAERLGDYNVAILASNMDGETYVSTTIEVHGTYKYGTFVLSEGSNAPGTIVFISPKGEVIENAYYVENGGELGGASQDLFIKNNKMYIISQNGGYDGGFLTILNAETLKRERKFQEELSGKVSWPTHVAVLGEDDIYIRDNNGVKRFQPSTGEVTLIQGTEGARKNTMAVADGKVFATVGKNVVVIEAGMDEVTNTIGFEDRVSGVIKASDGNLWVSDGSGNITKVDVKTYAKLGNSKVSDEAKRVLSASFAAAPSITAKGDTLYMSGLSSKIYRHVFGSDKTELMVDAKDMVDNVGIVYNTCAVHPVTGEVYLNSIKGYGNDSKINNISVLNFSGDEPKVSANYENYTAFPAGTFFTYNFK